jgi:FKBP-type peptidyl-prolyl cis-trans isomerase
MKTFASILLSAIFGMSVPQGVEEDTYVSENTPMTIEETIEDTEMRQYFYEVYELVKDKSFMITNEYYDPSLNIDEEELYSLLGRYTQFDTSIIRDEGKDKYVFKENKGTGVVFFSRIIDMNNKYYVEINDCKTRCGGYRNGSIYIYNKETNELIYFNTEASIYTLHKYGNEDQITGYYYNANKKYKETLNFDDKDNIHTIECEFLDHDRFNDKINYILNEQYLNEEQDSPFLDKKDIYINEFPYITKEEHRRLEEEQKEKEKQERAAENARKLEEQLKKQTENKEPTNINDDEIVYWTRGDSYHKKSDCHNYVQAKYHYSGTMKECPKFDPCDDCCY